MDSVMKREGGQVRTYYVCSVCEAGAKEKEGDPDGGESGRAEA